MVKKLLRNWLPAIVWMGVIFYFSSRTRTVVSDTYILNFLFFKFLHLIEYALLYFFLFLGFCFTKELHLTRKEIFVFPIFFSILYAISDEIHQTFVPTREGLLRDVFIDIAGILLMYSYMKRRFYVKN